MSGTAADREGGQKDTSQKDQEAQTKRDEQLAQGAEPDRTRKDELAHRGGSLVEYAEKAAGGPVVVIEPNEGGE
jgi:hypothetical protein